MLIDWFTTGAQIVNFLVLIFLLKRFLYGPVLRAMDRREQRIAEQLQQGEEMRLQAEKEADEFRRKRSELEQERASRLRQAEEEADRRRQELMDRAKGEAEALQEAWRKAARREQAEFIEALKKRTGVEVLQICRKLIADLTGEALDPRLVEVFTRKLRALSSAEKETFATEAGSGELVVRAPFEIDPSEQQKISAALIPICGGNLHIAYAVDPEMALGIEMSADGIRLSWGVDSYFEALGKNLSELFEESTAPKVREVAGAASEKGEKAAAPDRDES